MMDNRDRGFTNGGFTTQENGNWNKNMDDESRNDPVDTTNIECGIQDQHLKRENGQIRNISVLELFRFADTYDKCLLVVGTIAAIVNGLCHPVVFLVYGRAVTAFIYYEQIPKNATDAYNASLPFTIDDYTDVFENTSYFALIFCLLAIVCMVSGAIEYSSWEISMERQMLKIRSSLFTSIVHQDMSWFDVHGTGELSTSFTESLTKLEAGIGKEMVIFIQYTACCIGLYVTAIVEGWKLALACLTFAPLLILIGGLMINWLKNLSVVDSKAYAKAGSVATEVLMAIKTVMSFNGQAKETERYSQFLDTSMSMGIKKGLAMGLGMGLGWFIMFAMMATSFGYGVQLWAEDEPGIEPGNVLLIFLSVMVGSTYLARALPILEVIGNAKAAAMKVFTIIDTTPLIDSLSTTGLIPETIDGEIELRDVRFAYPSRPEVEVLKGVSISMKKGHTVAIVGHSGCGKSTIVQLIERFYEVASGQILIDGVDVRALNVKWLRSQIGLVSQEPVLFATTIRENIQYGRMDVTEEQVQDAARTANIHEFIQQLPMGYDTMVGQRGTQLSGGQKQRIAIARALVRDPKILLLDEATSALDNESEAVVQQALENAQKGRTTIMIAHRLSTIQKADLIIAMADGKVVETGTHDDLIARHGLYADLVRHQTRHNSDDDVILDLDDDYSEVKDDVHHGHHHEGGHSTVDYSSTTSHNLNRSEHTTEEGNKGDEGQYVSFRRLMRMNAPELRYLLTGSLCAGIGGALFPALTVLFTEYLRVFTIPDDERTDFTFAMTFIIIAVAVINTLLRIGQYVCLAVSGEILTSRLRRLTFESFLKQDMTFFDDPCNQVSTLTTRLSTHATEIQGATGSKLGYMTEAVACVISAVVISFVSSWKMALVVIVFLPLMVVTGTVSGRILLGFEKSNKALLEQAACICYETIDNVRVVASLTREDTFKQRYVGILTTVYRKSIKRCLLSSLALGCSFSCVYFGYAVSLTYGAYLMKEEGLAFHLVLRIFATILFSGLHIGRMGVQSGNFKKATIAASRLLSYIDRVPVINSASESDEKLTRLKGNISFQNVHFHYPFRSDLHVLNHLSLDVNAGETIALVGASGCGKSTTMSLMERFYDPSAGKVMVDGVDVGKMNLKWLRSQIGYVQQEPVLFDTSIANNIAYGANDREVSMDEIIAAARSANIHSFIDALPNGYDTNVGNKGTQLSGGQKQRIAIARAIISDPRILLLDEATSALDSKSEKIVQEALDVARQGRTCIVIAHRLSTIQNVDKIAIIHRGSVVEMGSHSELITAKGIYYKYTTLQTDRKGDNIV